MKLNDIIKGVCLSLAAAAFAGCSDWLEPKSINDTDFNGTVKTDEYYAALREWKQRPDLPQVFVWFDSWIGTSPAGASSMRGLPDSVTIVASWGTSFDLTPAMKEDMKYVQEVKGTKVVVTQFAANIGDGVEWQDVYNVPDNCSDPEILRPAIKTYAKAFYDKVIECGYDGFDWDYEPAGGGGSGNWLWRNDVQAGMFIEELSYWFGRGAMDPNRDRGDRPMPERRLLFIIDGEVGIRGRLEKEWLTYYVDYFVLQAYGGMSDTRMRGVLEDMDRHIQNGIVTPEAVVRRTIATESFEAYANTGGKFLDMSRYIYKATYTVNGEQYEIDQQIGGCGIYRVGLGYESSNGDYAGSPEYYYLRQGITELYRIYKQRNGEAGLDNGDAE